MTLPIRRAARPRSRTIRRASAGPRRRQFVGGIVAILAAAAIYAVSVVPAFQLRQLDVEGVTITPSASLDQALGLAAHPHPNVFAIDTERIRQALLGLPAVARASLSVELPGRLVVHVTERSPVLVWAVDDQRWFVDVDGLVLAPAPAGDPAAAGLPVFADDRSGRKPLAPGDLIAPTDLAVARQLGAVTPGMIHSSAASLSYEITDTDGYTVSSGPNGWLAIFGMYTPTLRPPSLVPAQVQCLSSLLAKQGERKVATVYLFPDGNECGTFIARSTK